MANAQRTVALLLVVADDRGNGFHPTESLTNRLRTQSRPLLLPELVLHDTLVAVEVWDDFVDNGEHAPVTDAFVP